MNLTNRKGFTLIELLVVISIIGVLASVVLVAVTNVRSLSRDAQRSENLQEVQTALELYYDSHGYYPPLSSQTNNDINYVLESNPPATVLSVDIETWNDLMSALNAGNYLTLAHQKILAKSDSSTPLAWAIGRLVGLLPSAQAVVTIQDPLYPNRSYAYVPSGAGPGQVAGQSYRMQAAVENTSDPALQGGITGNLFFTYVDTNRPWQNCAPTQGYYCTGPDRQSFNSFIPGKPVVYLYPTATTSVSVRIFPTSVDVSVPPYDGGWNVIAHPDGDILDPSTGSHYPYLYWEGHSGKPLVEESKGFVVARGDIKSFLTEALARQGLKPAEAQAFIEYWQPRITTADPYTYIYFMPQADYDRLVPMDITPKPDTLIRIYMLWKPLQTPVSVTPEILTSPARTGFTAVEWGGDRSPIH
ncbi:MAG: type II secretion system protein [Patescibacteria group bacterium]|nr:type II secretion system protein [Patescibacteria group bacterium]